MISNEERENFKKLDQPARDQAMQDNLRIIRENSTGPAMNHYAINDALDRIEVLTEKKPEPVKAAKPGDVGTGSANPAPFASSAPQPPLAPIGNTQNGTLVQPV